MTRGNSQSSRYVNIECMRFESPKPEKKIGTGGYKEAFLTEGPVRQVHLRFKHPYTHNQIKSVFYLNKIATKLFPNKIAIVTQVGNDSQEDGNQVTSAYTNYVEPDDQHVAMQSEALVYKFDGLQTTPEQDLAADRFFDLSEERMKIFDEPAVKEFLKKYERSGLVENFGKQAKWGPQDVIRNKDGSFTFVDVDVAWDEPEDLGETVYSKKLLRFDPKKLQHSIRALSEPARTGAQKAYDRLISLCKSTGFAID